MKSCDILCMQLSFPDTWGTAMLWIKKKKIWFIYNDFPDARSRLLIKFSSSATATQKKPPSPGKLCWRWLPPLLLPDDKDPRYTPHVCPPAHWLSPRCPLQGKYLQLSQWCKTLLHRCWGGGFMKVQVKSQCHHINLTCAVKYFETDLVRVTRKVSCHLDSQLHPWQAQEDRLCVLEWDASRRKTTSSDQLFWLAFIETKIFRRENWPMTICGRSVGAI